MAEIYTLRMRASSLSPRLLVQLLSLFLLELELDERNRCRSQIVIVFELKVAVFGHV